MGSGCTKKRVVAQVGKAPILQDDQEKYFKILQRLDPKATTTAALNTLIQNSVKYQVLDQMGIITTESEIQTAFEEIKRQSSSDKSIEKLVTLYGSDSDFRNLYVKPLVATQKLHSVAFPKDLDFHKASTKKLEEILSESISNPASFEEIASKHRVSLYRGQIDLKGSGLVWTGLRNVASNSASIPGGMGIARSWFRDFLKDVNDNQMINRLENLGDYFLVIRRDSSNEGEPNILNITAAVEPRKNFSAWVKEKTGQIKVERFQASQK